MLTIQRASLVVAFVLSFGAVPMNHAAAATTVLGSTICVRADLVGNASSGLIYTLGGVNNASGGPAEILCTLFRDNTTNLTGMQDLEMSISDPSTSPGGFSCNAFSLDRKGVIKKNVNRVNSVTGESVLDWGSSVNISVSKGYYAIHCTIPNGATIHSLYYLEP